MLLLLFVRRWLLAYFMFARGMKVGWSNSNGMVESVSRREQDLLGRWIRRRIFQHQPKDLTPTIITQTTLGMTCFLIQLPPRKRTHQRNNHDRNEMPVQLQESHIRCHINQP